MTTPAMPLLPVTAQEVALILHDETTDRYHAAHFTAMPFPGRQQDSTVLRLRCRQHHTTGSETLQGAEAELDKLAAVLAIPEDSTLKGGAVEWDGELGVVLILPSRR